MHLMANCILIIFFYTPDSLLTLILISLLGLIILAMDVYATFQEAKQLEKEQLEIKHANTTNLMSKTQEKLWNNEKDEPHDNHSEISNGMKETKIIFDDVLDFEDGMGSDATKSGGAFSPTRRSRRFRNMEPRNTNILKVRQQNAEISGGNLS